MTKLALWLIGAGALFLTSGCASFLARQGTDVTRFAPRGSHHEAPAKRVTRAQVLERYGTPYATKSYEPALSIKQARKIGVLRRAGSGYVSYNDGTDLEKAGARIDEFRIHGPIVTQKNRDSAPYIAMLGWRSLGLSEALLFPLAAYGYVEQFDNVTQVDVIYGPGDIYWDQMITYQQQLKRGERHRSRIR